MPALSPPGRRWRSSTIVTPTTISPRASARNSTSASVLGHEPADLGGAGPPVVTARVVLLLPDRDRLLEGVDAVPGRVERRGAVGTRHHDRDRRLAQREPPGAMEQRDPGEVRPAQPR